MIRRLLFTAHRILGTILSILFVVWFLSGFVMLYHNFPKITNKDKYAHTDVLTQIPVSLDSILSKIEDNENIIGLKFASFGNRAYFEVVTPDTTYKLSDAHSPLLNYYQIENYAKRWNSASILKVDTLNELEQWIPFSRYRKDFPIYKFYFNDDDKSQLYVSSQTGEPLQFTNKDNRFWAWLGPIPHWIYFTSLRQSGQLWSDVLIWISGFGSIMCLSGLVLGIYLYIGRYRKKKKWGTPYKKFVYKWHHILGFFFGFFVFTFVFSGMMSLAHIPQWIVKTDNSAIQERLLLPRSIIIDQYKLSISNILKAYPQKVKSIEWTSFGSKPLYKVVVKDEQLTIEATNNIVKLLNLRENDIRTFFKKKHSDSIKIRLLNEYDNYYITRKDQLPLPVYRVDIVDSDKSTYYIDPKTGNTQYFNSNDKARKWSYQALHSFKIPFLIRNTIIWNIIMWTTMVGGTLVSLTGLWLAIKHISRKLKKRKKHIHNSKKKKYMPEGRIIVAGIGPGSKEDITPAVLEAIKISDVVVGYKYYFQFIEDCVRPDTLCIDTGMKKERQRAEEAFMYAEEGKTVCVISSGDAGIYGMVPLIYEMKKEKNSSIEVVVLPGISAFQKAAALLGAPIGHDFCIISLSDLMTPWDRIEKRIIAAASADFVTAIYNPKSNGRYWQLYRLIELFLKDRSPDTPIGYVRQAGREEQEIKVTTLAKFDPEEIDMFTIIIIGNSQSYLFDNSTIITPRGYYREAKNEEVGIGQDIMIRSFRTIESELKNKEIPLDKKWALLHAIHTTADFDMENILYVDDKAVESLYNKCPNGELKMIITDVTMVTSGIRKGALERLGIEVKCYLHDDRVTELAKSKNITRTQAGIRLAVQEYPNALYVFGNAPTALIELCELTRKGKAKPMGIIASPVGFVNVKESKHMAKPFKDIPKLIVEGRKGGSNLAATLVNSILTFDDAKQLKPGRDV